MKNKVILTGSLGNRPFKKYAYYSMYEYAKKVDADVHICSDIAIPDDLNNFKVEIIIKHTLKNYYGLKKH